MLPRLLLALMALGSPPVPIGGSLSIASDPPGATVYLNGEARGLTPLSLGGLPPGDHRVKVVKPGYLDNSRLLSLRTGEPRALQVKLTPHAPEPRRFAQVEQQKEEKKGGGKKALWIGLGVVAAGAVTYALLPGNKAPTAGSIEVSPPGSGLASVTSFTFTAQGASDPDGDALSYTWNFGDGGSATGQTISHIFAAPGSFNVNLSVSDGKIQATTSTTVNVRSFTGTWVGRLTNCPTCTVVFTFTLTQTGSAVSGSYFDTVNGSGSVSGTLSPPRQVVLTHSIPGFRRGNWIGSLSASLDQVTGSTDWFDDSVFNFNLERR